MSLDSFIHSVGFPQGFNGVHFRPAESGKSFETEKITANSGFEFPTPTNADMEDMGQLGFIL